MKKGDTVFVIATCADALHRASGTCWFYEMGGCPFQESGRLEYCGERENVPDVFEATVESVSRVYDEIRVRGFDFQSVVQGISLRHNLGKRIFTKRADALEALERMEQGRERKRKERRERRKEWRERAAMIDGQCGLFEEVSDNGQTGPSDAPRP